MLFGDLRPLSSSFLAARLVREDVLALPVLPERRDALERAILARNAGDGLTPEAVRRAVEIGRALAEETDSAVVTAAHLDALAAACGAGGPRAGPGLPFHGRAPPPPGRAASLVDQVIDAVNEPAAVETWPPIARAFALHFLLRLVQPFAAPPIALARAGELLLLAAEDFPGDRLVLPGAAEVGAPVDGHPSPDSFAQARTDALVEALGVSRDLILGAVSRDLAVRHAEARGNGLGPRQRRLLRWLAEGDDPTVPRALGFQDYVGLHAGRGAPSLRSLQRDWAGLVARGWLEAAPGGGHMLSVRVLEWGSDRGSRA